MGHPSDLNLQLYDVAADLSFQNGQSLFDQQNLTGPRQNEPAKVAELGLRARSAAPFSKTGYLPTLWHEF